MEIARGGDVGAGLGGVAGYLAGARGSGLVFKPITVHPIPRDCTRWEG